MSDCRWIRLDVNWDASEWVFCMSEGSQLAWVKLLCYVKQVGVHNNPGVVKRMAPIVASRKWGVGEESVVKMEQAAIVAGAIEIKDGDWVIVKWAEFQSPDAERVRRSRLSVTTRNNPGVVADTCHATETETKTETGINPPIVPPRGKRERVKFVPPTNIECATYAKEIGLPLAEAKTFFDHFTSNGWKVGGKAPMQDWKAAMRTWLARYEKEHPPSRPADRQRPPRFQEAG